jgi:dTDP-4-amino-4,6-dideoxygalactose transaminase
MTTVPFLDLKAQYATIREEIESAIQDVLTSGWFILGRQVEAFERAFSDYLEGCEAVAVGSGTDALHLALRACGVGNGDEVITVSNSFIATALAISYVGASPVFVDIEPGTHTLDASRLSEHITSRTKAIVPVHLFGQPADMEPICEIARRRGLYVIEDACQAHGARYRGRPAGTIGDIGCFSFYPGKNLGAYGDGGAAVTRSPQLVTQLRMLRNYGQTRKYYHRIRGFNSRLDELQAAILSVKLRHLERWNEARRGIAARYDAALGPGVVVPFQREGSQHVYHLYVIRCAQRDDLQRWLAEHGIGTQIHYPIPIHLQEAYSDLGITKGSLPATEKASAEVLSLPIFPELTAAQIDQVIATVNSFPGQAA